ncbi:MAG: hypothetical protein KDI61_12755 [Alphaproteobacteria bacterium]|nr:hypothetical protein [Alphaproteobacteria bacterium]MCB1841113.1 hypothetical protein [Alphaproteobacteria bacterium]
MARARRLKEYIDSDPPTFSLWWHVVSVFLCYLFGVLSFMVAVFMNAGPMIAFVSLVGPICGLPFIGLAFLGFVFRKEAIEQDPLLLCVILPFAVALCWYGIEVFFLGGDFHEKSAFGFPHFFEYSLTTRLSYAFFVSAYSSNLYYWLLRDVMRRERNKRIKHALERGEEI